MKKNISLLFISILAACSQNPEEPSPVANSAALVNFTPEEFLSIAYDNSKEIEDEEAIAQVSHFLSAIEISKRISRTNSSNAVLEIIGKTTFSSNENHVDSQSSENELEFLVFTAI